MDAAVVIPVGSVDEILRDQVARVLAQTGVSLREVVLSVNSTSPAVVAGVRTVLDGCNDPVQLFTRTLEPVRTPETMHRPAVIFEHGASNAISVARRAARPVGRAIKLDA